MHSEDFFNAITSAPVPVDTRALRVLNHSPLALDLYGWATYKAYTVTAKGQAQFIGYSDFMSQLGEPNYTGPDGRKNFKKKLRYSQEGEGGSIRSSRLRR